MHVVLGWLQLLKQCVRAVQRWDVLGRRHASHVHALRSWTYERRRLLQQRRLQLVRGGLLELPNNDHGLQPVRCRIRLLDLVRRGHLLAVYWGNVGCCRRHGRLSDVLRL